MVSAIASGEGVSPGPPPGAERGRVKEALNTAKTLAKKVPGVARAAKWWDTARSIAKDPGGYMQGLLASTAPEQQAPPQGQEGADTAARDVALKQAQQEANATRTVQSAIWQDPTDRSTHELLIHPAEHRPTIDNRDQNVTSDAAHEHPNRTVVVSEQPDSPEQRAHDLLSQPETATFLAEFGRESLAARGLRMLMSPGMGQNEKLEQEGLAQLKISEANMTVVSGLLKDIPIANLTSGKELLDVLAGQITTMQQEGVNLQSLFGESQDDTVGALRRLQRAFMKNGYSDAGRALLALRRQSGYTLPRHAWSNKDLIGLGIMKMASSAMSSAAQMLESVKPYASA